MTDREILHSQATDKMREALVLLDLLGADLAAVHVQWALDLVKKPRVSARLSIGVQTGPPIGAQKGPPFTMAQG